MPRGLDLDRPSAGRIYDYLLGGAHNFKVDRQVAEQVLTVFPEAPLVAHANRAFLRRAVQWMTEAGIRQFLDIGSGIPTVGHVHEFAQEAAADARVIYVDIDPMAVAHSTEILAGNDRVATFQEDVRRPEQILRHPEVRRLFDLTQPVAVLVIALLHFIPDDDDPCGVMSRLMAPLTSGSHLAISHVTAEGTPDAVSLKEIYRRSGITVVDRSRQQISALFGGCRLVEPGLVWLPQWHPEAPGQMGARPADTGCYAGVARKV